MIVIQQRHLSHTLIPILQINFGNSFFTDNQQCKYTVLNKTASKFYILNFILYFCIHNIKNADDGF